MYSGRPRTRRSINDIRAEWNRSRAPAPPIQEIRRQLAIRRLQAFQYGAYDDPREAVAYDQQQDFFAGFQEDLAKEYFPALSKSGSQKLGPLPNWWIGVGDEDLAAGGLGLRIKLRLPKFIRKMKPLKVLGRVAPIVAGGFLAPKLVGGVGKLFRKKGIRVPAIAPGAIPSPDEIASAAAQTAQVIRDVEQTLPNLQPVPTTATVTTAYQSPGGGGGDGGGGSPAGGGGGEEMAAPAQAGGGFDMKKLAIPALAAGALLLLSRRSN